MMIFSGTDSQSEEIFKLWNEDKKSIHNIKSFSSTMCRIFFNILLDGGG